MAKNPDPRKKERRRKRRRGFLYFIIASILTGAIAFFIADEPLPQGSAGDEAEVLTDKMLTAVNADAWDKISYISWTFRGDHKYVWDKKRHCARIEWSDVVVLLNLNTKEGSVWQTGQPLAGDALKVALGQAYEYWCNDSFWLNPVVKVRDPGTNRQIVDLDDGTQGLLVTYTSGGVTPGDSYLWTFSENGFPKAWKMWVDIAPIGGLEFSWEGWKQLPGGAWVSTLHQGAVFDIPVEGIVVGNSLSDFGLADDLFSNL